MLQICVRGIAAPHPENRRRSTQALLKQNEIDILRHDRDVRFSRGQEDARILRAQQVQIPNAVGFDRKFFCQPRRERRRQLRINPNDHATNTGWSIRREANRSDAWRSSASRSGISSRICSAERPAANRSSTSLTLMRIPRIHGRPPHCSGSTVIRSASVFTCRV